MAMRWPCIEERFVAKIEHDTAKKTRSDVARKARIQARNDTPFTEAKAAREKKAEAAVKDEEAAAMPKISYPKTLIAVGGKWPLRSRWLCRSTSR